MSEDSAVVDSEVVDPVLAEVRAQLKVASAIREYLRAAETFERVSKEFSESCHALRVAIKPNSKFVFRESYSQSHLVQSDAEGNFTVEPIEVI